jgi:hypothetical protein
MLRSAGVAAFAQRLVRLRLSIRWQAKQHWLKLPEAKAVISRNGERMKSITVNVKNAVSA